MLYTRSGFENDFEDLEEIAELNGCCSCAPGPGQAADLICSGQFCDLFDRQDTHFSSWSPLPVHTIISDGASGFACPAFLLDGQTDLLPVPAAKAFHYMECQSVKQTLQAAAAAAAILVACPSGAGLSLDSGLVLFSSGTVVKYALKKTRLHLSARGRNKDAQSKRSQESCYFSDLQALTQAHSGEANCFEDSADSEGGCVLFKGKDRHDTDGGLSLGFGEASGRVDVPVSVGALPSSAGLNSLSPSLPLALAS